jgi:hypothetical protein
MSHLTINTRVRRLINYVEDIEKGLVQIPEFQRDFIWDSKNMLDFFDSIKKNYPIGSILFWQPDAEEFGKAQYIGPYRIPQEHENFFYVLDGFQRLSTIFGCLINPGKKLIEDIDQTLLKKFRICYDLENEEFFIPRSTKLANYQVNIYQLIDTRATYGYERTLKELKLKDSLIEKYLDRYEKLGTTIIDYQLPSIDIIGGTIDEAVEIFSRVNSKGKEISQDWMVSALSYSKNSGFRLGDEINHLIEELKNFGWGGLKRDVIFNCIINSFGKYYVDQSKRIEQLAKQSDFAIKSRIVFEGIKKAVKFLFEELLVVDDKLLPYYNQLIFISDFFIIVQEPTTLQLSKIKNWFWKTTLTNYFTIYSLSKQRAAYNHFKLFLNDFEEDPFYDDSLMGEFIVTKWPNKITFGSVRSKGIILFLLNHYNNWQKYDFSFNIGYNLFFLHESSPAETVAILKNLRNNDLNFQNPNISESELKKCFLTTEILTGLKNGDINCQIIRENLIKSAEEDLAEKLGLKYLDEYNEY